MTRVILIVFTLVFATVVYNLPTFDEAVADAKARTAEREHPHN